MSHVSRSKGGRNSSDLSLVTALGRTTAADVAYTREKGKEGMNLQGFNDAAQDSSTGLTLAAVRDHLDSALPS